MPSMAAPEPRAKYPRHLNFFTTHLQGDFVDAKEKETGASKSEVIRYYMAMGVAAELAGWRPPEE